MALNNKGSTGSYQAEITWLMRLLDAMCIPFGLKLLFLWLHIQGSVSDWLLVTLGVIFYYFVAEFNQIYVSWRGMPIYREIQRIGLVWFIAAAFMFMSGYLLLDIPHLHGAMKVRLFLIVLGLLTTYRIGLRLVLRWVRRKGRNTRSALIVGAGDVGRRLAAQFLEAPWMGLVCEGFVDDGPTQFIDVSLASGRVKPLPVLGHTESVRDLVERNRIDRVYIALTMDEATKIQDIVSQLQDTTASVYLVPDIFMFELLHSRMESINGIVSVSIFESPLEGTNAILKRVEDVVLSLLILTVLSLPMLAIALAVRLTSPGPAIFRQTRYGLDGRPISVMKFRTMKVMEDGDNVQQAKPGDERLTPIGGLLRRTSIDELPQFFNVLKGEMSIVGPRPHAVAHNEVYRKLIGGYMLRHKVKPGITGWAQVNGWRGETDTLEKMERRIEHDLEYIRNWSLAFDFKIIALTSIKGFVNKNAY